MDFFERAHVPRKSSKMENKADEALKRQLKQMMSAYKQGNNQDIRNSSEVKPKFDLDETISISDYSEDSVNDSENNMGTVFSNSKIHSSSNEGNSSKSNSLDTDENNGEDTEDITECCEEFKALSTSVDDSASTSFGNSSAVFESSDSTDSELSLPSSLQTYTSSGTPGSDDEFDADGTLAYKILENLGKKGNDCMKRKIPKKNVELEIEKDVNKTKTKSTPEVKTKNKSKKPKQATHNNSTEYFLEEDVDEFEKEMIFKDTKNDKKLMQKKSHANIELNDDSINNSMDSTETSFSLPFISVSAEDMSNHSLGELLGGYVHPTIRNLPTDNQGIHVINTDSKLSADDVTVKNVIADDISSLVPEIDEEDFCLDTDTQGLIERSNSHSNIAEELMMTCSVEYDTNDSIAMDETTVEDELTIEGSVPIKLYNGNDKYVLVMKHPAELYIHGKVVMADINGMVEIFGYKFNYDCIEVYAPYSNFAYRLKTLENPHQVNPDLFNELISAGLLVTDAKEIVSAIEHNTAVVILSKLENRMIDYVDNTFNSTDLFTKRSVSTPRFLKKATESLGCSFYLRPPKRCFEEKPIWEDVYASGSKYYFSFMACTQSMGCRVSMRVVA